MLKITISLVIYHQPQAFTTADCRFSIIFCKGKDLWKFQVESNYQEIFPFR